MPRRGNDMGEWTHRYVSVGGYPSYGAGYMIKVEAGLLHLQGNARPYFSVTAEIYKPKARDCDACGCLHDDILKFWPELAPVVALHLCDDNGRPTYAEANGWYQLTGYYGGYGEQYHAGNSQGNYPKAGGRWDYRLPTPDECLLRFADHVRIPLETARELAETWRCDDDPKATRRWFESWVDEQTNRWKTEAVAATLLLDQLIAEKM